MTCTVHPLYKVVSDVRFAQSSSFARESERLGVPVVRINGDITDFWFNDLSRRWTEQPAAIAGLTAHGPLFCLERFAWDHGMRVVLRGTHQMLDAGRIEHSISAPAGTVALARGLGLETEGWARGIAHLVTACEVGRERASTTIATRSEIREPLVSWVIASPEAISPRSM